MKKITSSTVFEVTEVWKASVIEARWVPPVGGFGREPPVGGCILEVFVGDPPVGGLGVCRWVVKRIGKKRCDLKPQKT